MRKYSSIFANEEHALITDVLQIKDWRSTMGFFLNGKDIGTGRLVLRNRSKKWVNTTSTEIFTKWRNKGHGIELYRALIETARKVGATRIYSDVRLNKFSRRMWREKLARLGYVVKQSVACKNACRHCKLKTRYYINLKVGK